MYIYLLIRNHCNIALVVLNFVNFDNFLTSPNRKILQVKHNSGWNFKRLQTHVTQMASVTSKTVQTNANTLSNVSTFQCQSGRLAAGGGNQHECWNSKTLCSFAGEETQAVSEPQCTHSAPLHRLTPITWNSHNLRLTCCIDLARNGNSGCANQILGCAKCHFSWKSPWNWKNLGDFRVCN